MGGEGCQGDWVRPAEVVAIIVVNVVMMAHPVDDISQLLFSPLEVYRDGGRKIPWGLKYRVLTVLPEESCSD